MEKEKDNLDKVQQKQKLEIVSKEEVDQENLDTFDQNYVNFQSRKKELTCYKKKQKIENIRENRELRNNDITKAQNIGKNKYGFLRQTKRINQIKKAVKYWIEELPSKRMQTFTFFQYKIIQDISSYYPDSWNNPLQVKILKDQKNYEEVDNLKFYSKLRRNKVKLKNSKECQIKDNDNTGFFKNFKFKNICKIYYSTPTFEPNDKKAFIFHTLNCSITMAQFYFYSICIFFQENLGQQAYFQILLTIAVPIYFINIIVNLNTAIYENGHLVYDKNKIAKHYWKLIMKIDIIGLFITLFNLINNQHLAQIVIFGFIFSVKLRSIQYSLKFLEQQIYIFGNANHYYSLFKMLFNTAALCHAIGIIWHSLAYIEKEYLHMNNTWVIELQLENDSWFIKYLFSFYWAASTMMLVGNAPGNYVELGFTSIILFATVGVFAYILNTISQILVDLNFQHQIYVKDIKAINRYMTDKGTNKELQGKILNYLEYYFKSYVHMVQNEEVKLVLDKIPKVLKEELLYEVNVKGFQQFNQFYTYFSKNTVEKLISKIEDVQMLPQVVLFKEQQIEDQYLYVIKTGTVYLTKNYGLGQKKEAIIKKCEKGDLIGTHYFISGIDCGYTARCHTSCSFYKIERQQFLDIIQENKQDMEKLESIRQDIIHKGYSTKITGLNCVICQKEHQFQKCSQIFSQFDPQRLAMFNNLPVYNQRNRYFRCKDRKNGYLSELEELQIAAEEIFYNPQNRLIIYNLIEHFNQKNSKFYCPDEDEEDLEDEEMSEVIQNYNSEKNISIIKNDSYIDTQCSQINFSSQDSKINQNSQFSSQKQRKFKEKKQSTLNQNQNQNQGLNQDDNTICFYNNNSQQKLCYKISNFDKNQKKDGTVLIHSSNQEQQNSQSLEYVVGQQ